MDLYHYYVSEEMNVQNLWLLFNLTNTWIDSCLESKLSIKDLIDSSFELLFYEAQYKYINSKTTHRYRMEIINILYQISGLNTIDDYFKEKTKLIERKIQIESSEREKNNDSKENMTLFILTIVSTISAIFQVINYWFDAPNHNNASIFTTIVIVIIVVIALILRYFFSKHRK